MKYFCQKGTDECDGFRRISQQPTTSECHGSERCYVSVKRGAGRHDSGCPCGCGAPTHRDGRQGGGLPHWVIMCTSTLWRPFHWVMFSVHRQVHTLMTAEVLLFSPTALCYLFCSRLALKPTLISIVRSPFHLKTRRAPAKLEALHGCPERVLTWTLLPSRCRGGLLPLHRERGSHLATATQWIS